MTDADSNPGATPTDRLPSIFRHLIGLADQQEGLLAEITDAAAADDSERALRAAVALADHRAKAKLRNSYVP